MDLNQNQQDVPGLKQQPQPLQNNDVQVVKSFN